MNEAELEQLMAESTRQFNDLKVKEGGLKLELETVDTSLKQLQGEYEAYNTVKQTLTERRKAIADETAKTDKPKKEVTRATE